MAAKKKIVINGRWYKMYEQSIQVEGIAKFFWYKRAVDEQDVRLLAIKLMKPRLTPYPMKNKTKSRVENPLKRSLEF